MLHPFRTPGLPQQQRDEMNSRAFQRFGRLLDDPSDAGFEALTPDSVFALTLRYVNGFVPDKPLQYDEAKAQCGGYPIHHILVCVAKVIKLLPSGDEAVVELEQPVMLSFGSGPMFRASKYVLHRRGHVRYLNHHGQPRDWAEDFRPTWEYTVFPVLPVIVQVF